MYLEAGPPAYLKPSKFHGSAILRYGETTPSNGNRAPSSRSIDSTLCVTFIFKDAG